MNDDDELNAKNLHEPVFLHLVEDNIIARAKSEIAQSLEDQATLRTRIIAGILAFIALVVAPITGYFVQSTFKGMENRIIQQTEKLIEVNNQKQTSLIEKYSKQAGAQLRVTEENNLKLAQSIQDEILLLALGNETISMQKSSEYRLSEVKTLINDLEFVSSKNSLLQNRALPNIVKNALSFLLEHDLDNEFKQVYQLFKPLIYNSKELTTLCLKFFTMQVLGDSNVANIAGSNNYKTFNELIGGAEKFQLYSMIIPSEISTKFVMNFNKPNRAINDLFELIQRQSSIDRALTLWELAKYADPIFWKVSPTPIDYRIARIYDLLLREYKNYLQEIGQDFAVKSAIKILVNNRIHSSGDIKTGEFLQNYLYPAQQEATRTILFDSQSQQAVAKKASNALPVASETILSAMDFDIDDIFTIEDGEYEQMMYQEQFIDDQYIMMDEKDIEEFN